MGNFKIKVNSEAESREVQGLLKSIGYHRPYSNFVLHDGWVCFNGEHEILCVCNTQAGEDLKDYKEITLPELRAMVKPVKEYLDKQKDGTYKLITVSSGCADRDWIEVPEGAEILTEVANGLFFYKKQGDRFAYCFAGETEWRNTLINPYDDPKAFVCGFLWQRTPSLSDQYAEIEKARQAIKPYGNDSEHAVDAISYDPDGVNIKHERQHRHYFIDVSDVDEIDFYEIALRYNVTDPCIQHILKKCLAVGQRGQKDFHHDLKDIYDTAKRMLDVHGLDS